MRTGTRTIRGKRGGKMKKNIIKLKKKRIRRLYYRWKVPRDTHRVGKDGVSTYLFRSKLIRHIGLRRKHQQKNGAVPGQTVWAPIWSYQNPLGTLGCGESINKKRVLCRVEGERCAHQFSWKCKKDENNTGWCTPLPIIHKDAHHYFLEMHSFTHLAILKCIRSMSFVRYT